MSASLARAADVRAGHALSWLAALGAVIAPLLALASLHSGAEHRGSASPWLAFTDPVLRALLSESVLRAALTGTLAGIAGLGLGVSLATGSRRGTRLAALLHLLPLCLPPYLLALGAVHTTARGGPVDALAPSGLRVALDHALHGPVGLVGIQLLALTPLVTLLVLAAVRGADPAPVEAAVLARGPRAALLGVVSWQALPAALAGATLVFLLSLGEVAAPTLLGVKSYAGTVFARLADLSFLPGEALSRSLPLVLFALLGTAALAWLDRGGAALPSARSGRGLAPDLLGRGPARSTLLVGAGLLGLLPLLGLVWAASRGALHAPSAPTLAALGRSLAYAGATAALLVAAGWLAGHAWSRDPRGAGAASIALLGLALPGVVLGTGLIALWNRPTTAWIYGGPAVVLLGLSGRYLYVALRAFKVGLDAVPVAEEEAAWVARSSGVARWGWVVLPRSARAALGTWLLLALLCLRDLDTTLAAYPPGGETLAVRILTLEANAPPSQTAALALLQIALSALLGLGLALLARQRTA